MDLPLSPFVLPGALVLFGAVMGSFFNVLIYRVPRGLSIVVPASRCGTCGAPIPWWANIPIISYLALRGRCLSCGTKIPLRYLLVEILTPSAYLLLSLRNAPDHLLQWGIEALFLSILIIVTFTDLETYLIPDVFSIGGLVAGLAVSPWNSDITFIEALIGAIFGGAVLAAIAWGYHRIRGVEGMGGGDVKLLAMIGAFTGWQGALLALFSSALLGALAGCVLILLNSLRHRLASSREKPRDEESAGRGLATMIPYGPFLAIGGTIALLWGKTFWHWYLGGW